MLVTDSKVLYTLCLSNSTLYFFELGEEVFFDWNEAFEDTEEISFDRARAMYRNALGKRYEVLSDADFWEQVPKEIDARLRSQIALYEL